MAAVFTTRVLGAQTKTMGYKVREARWRPLEFTGSISAPAQETLHYVNVNFEPRARSPGAVATRLGSTNSQKEQK